eukprot:2784048-Prymnesium_polylepis.1
MEVKSDCRSAFIRRGSCHASPEPRAHRTHAVTEHCARAKRNPPCWDLGLGCCSRPCGAELPLPHTGSGTVRLRSGHGGSGHGFNPQFTIEPRQL